MPVKIYLLRNSEHYRRVCGMAEARNNAQPYINGYNSGRTGVISVSFGMQAQLGVMLRNGPSAKFVAYSERKI